MEFDAVLLPPRRAASVAQGLWHDRTINDELDACVAACPDKLALTAVQVETGAGTPLHLPRAGGAWPIASRSACRAWASAATTWSRCSCRTGGSSR